MDGDVWSMSERSGVEEHHAMQGGIGISLRSHSGIPLSVASWTHMMSVILIEIRTVILIEVRTYYVKQPTFQFKQLSAIPSPLLL